MHSCACVIQHYSGRPSNICWEPYDELPQSSMGRQAFLQSRAGFMHWPGALELGRFLRTRLPYTCSTIDTTLTAVRLLAMRITPLFNALIPGSSDLYTLIQSRISRVPRLFIGHMNKRVGCHCLAANAICRRPRHGHRFALISRLNGHSEIRVRSESKFGTSMAIEVLDDSGVGRPSLFTRTCYV